MDLVDTTLNACHCLLFMKVRVVGFGDSSAFGVAVGVTVEVFVGVAVAVGENVAVAVGVNVAVEVGEGVSVCVGVCVGVGVGMARSVSVTLRVAPSGKGFLDVSNTSICCRLLLDWHWRSVYSDELTFVNVRLPILRLTKSEGLRQRLSSN